jgi:hypothetical protein
MFVRSAAARLRAPFVTTVIVALVLALAVPLTAVATPLASIDATLLVRSQGTGNPLLLVAGQLPEGTPLPAELVLPVPEGAVVEWSGEILGGTAEDDAETPATIEVRDGVTVAVLNMSQSLIGQVEVSFPGAVTPAVGDTFTGGFALTAPSDAAMVRVAVGLESSTEAADLPDGTLSAQDQQGYTYYYQELSALSAGDPIEFSIQYRMTGTPVAAGTGSPPGSSAEVPPLLIALIAAVFAGAVLTVFASRARTKGAAEEFAADEAGDDSDGEYAAVAEDTSASEYVLFDTDPDEAPEPERGSGFDPDLAPESGTEPDAPSPSGWLTPQRLVIVAVVLAVGIAAAVILGSQQGQVGVTESADGWIAQRISTASGDTTTELNLQITCECSPEQEAPKMFEALRRVPGVAYAELEAATLLMRVQYDPAQTDQAAIALALKGAGYVP